MNTKTDILAQGIPKFERTFVQFGGHRRFAVGAMFVLFCLTATWVFAASPALALAEPPQWTVTAVSKPTNFAPEDVSGQAVYRVEVTNTGGASSDGTPVTITDELPAGLALAPAGASGEDRLASVKKEQPGAKFKCALTTCTFTGSVVPEDTLVLTFPVDVLSSSEQVVTNVVRVAGGGALDASMRAPTAISNAAAGFGLSPGGETTALSSSQAGAHPDITTSIAFNTVNYKGSLAQEPKDLITEEPPGFAGDLVDTPACAPAQFQRTECPIGTQVGVTTIAVLALNDNVPHIETDAVYNLSPNPGEVAKFGFNVIGEIGIQGNVSVRPGDYGLRVAFHNTNEVIAQLDAVSLTVWGVPAAKIHDTWRWKPHTSGKSGGLEEGFGEASSLFPVPYFTNPTSCEGRQFAAVFSVDSWEDPASFVGAEMPFGPIVGCDRLSLPASFAAEPTTENAGAATGLDVSLGVKQTYENAEGLASSTLNKAVVTLPEGMTVNPSAGAGLAACTLAEYAEEALEEAAGRGCPNESKLGTVTIDTPALKERATGSVFLAEPAPNGEAGKNPFDSLLAIYVVARFKERGVVVKVAGRVSADERTGRLVTTFERQPRLGGAPGLEGLPPVPFTLFTFKFHQGTTSPLVTPPLCGAYAVIAQLSPWSDPQEALVPELHPFAISHGFDGGACPSGTPPFSPQVIAGTQSNDAGSYSPMYIRVIRGDGEQEITRFSATLPPGLTANLTGVPFCPDANIEVARGKTGAAEEANPSCPLSSEIGHTLVGAGVGSVLAQAHGKVYMAGPHNGAPFSIVAITSAKVGPFDLGTVVVRVALRIDPTTAVVTVDAAASDPIPHIIKGIVVHVRDIRVYVDRPNFTLNPTSCARMTLSATIDGAGADPSNPADQQPVTVVDPFQAAECQSLKFKPVFKVATSGKTSRANGASLTVKLAYPKAPQGTQANIRSVKVDLPRQLPSRLTTLQKACPDRTFNANPAACPTASRVGHATAVTPILPVPLTGPAYFVSHGGAKFPELIIVLQGYGVTIDLHGETFISKAGITSSTFRTVPDQPVSTFQLTLPQGPDSALAANGNLCKSKLRMPTVFTAQNGLAIHQRTKITVTGCPRRKERARPKKKK
jgi:uncharacterized repeat protein (TIGR01451 family)